MLKWLRYWLYPYTSTSSTLPSQHFRINAGPRALSARYCIPPERSHSRCYWTIQLAAQDSSIPAYAYYVVTGQALSSNLQESGPRKPLSMLFLVVVRSDRRGRFAATLLRDSAPAARVVLPGFLLFVHCTQRPKLWDQHTNFEDFWTAHQEIVLLSLRLASLAVGTTSESLERSALLCDV